MVGLFKPLTDKELERIYKKYVLGNHKVICAQNHVHGFNCVEFASEQTMIIERLRVEVILLKHKLTQINNITK